MKKSRFMNVLFEQILIGLLVILIGYNTTIIIIGKEIYGLIPILIEVILLVLIITKNRYVKAAIITWSVIFLIIGFGFKFLADLIDDVNNNTFNFNQIGILSLNLFPLMVGIIIIDYSRRTIKIDS